MSVIPENERIVRVDIDEYVEEEDPVSHLPVYHFLYSYSLHGVCVCVCVCCRPPSLPADRLLQLSRMDVMMPFYTGHLVSDGRELEVHSYLMVFLKFVQV